MTQMFLTPAAGLSRRRRRHLHLRLRWNLPVWVRRFRHDLPVGRKYTRTLVKQRATRGRTHFRRPPPLKYLENSAKTVKKKATIPPDMGLFRALLTEQAV